MGNSKTLQDTKRALIGIDTNMPDPDVVSFTVDVLSYIIGDM